METIFREYDIRGIYQKELNEKSVKLIGYFLSKRIQGEYVSIGYDARTHSPILFEYLASGLNMGGKKVLNMGLVPTPVNYFSNYQEFDGITPSASIMITGSHNPSEYNGFKITIDKKPFFGEQIYALGKEIIANIDTIIPDNTTHKVIDVKSRYIAYLSEQFKDIKIPNKIVIDCGNGVAGVVIEDILKNVGIDYVGLFTEPDGTFPNHHPDPTEEENLEDIKHTMKHDDIKLGFAYDGDSDRIAVLTQQNNIKGDILALLFAKGMTNPVIVGEVKCSQVMYDEINKIGTAIMYKTGHSNLKVKIKETNANLAAEVSGHIFFNDRFFGFDDAIYATFRVLELVSNGMDIDSEIAKLPVVYSTEEIKVKTTEQEKFKIIDKLKELLQNVPEDFPKIKNIIDVDGVRVNFENGWGLVRASNTTPVLVTRFEALTQDEAKLYETKLNELIIKAKDSIK